MKSSQNLFEVDPRLISITYTKSLNHPYQILLILRPSHHLHIITNSAISLTRLAHTPTHYFKKWATLHCIPLISRVMPPLQRQLHLQTPPLYPRKSSSLFSSTWHLDASNSCDALCCRCICQRNTAALLGVKQESRTQRHHGSVKGVISSDHNSGATLRSN